MVTVNALHTLCSAKPPPPPPVVSASHQGAPGVRLVAPADGYGVVLVAYTPGWAGAALACLREEAVGWGRAILTNKEPLTRSTAVGGSAVALEIPLLSYEAPGALSQQRYPGRKLQATR
jgi:hypothetical protein